MSTGAPVSEVRLALGGQRAAFVYAAGFSAVIGMLMFAAPFYMYEVFVRVVTSRSLSTLIWLTVLVSMAFVMLELLQWVRRGILRQAAEGFDRTLANRVHDAVFRASLKGERAQAQRGLFDFAAVRDFICGQTMTAMMDVPVSLLLILAIFLIHPLLGWFALGSVAVQGMMTFFNNRTSGKMLAQAGLLSMQGKNFVEASLRNSEVVQAMGMSPGLRQRWLKTQKEMLLNQATASDYVGVFSALSKFVQVGSGSLILGLGAWLLIDGDVAATDVGLILIASILAGRALMPLVQVIMGWSTVADAKESISQLNTLLSMVPTEVDRLPLPVPTGHLTAEYITAVAPGAAPGARPILRNVAFDLPAGKMLTIVGHSASGKSSLANLLVGAWQASSGAVRLDGVDIHAWNKAELGPHIGYLPQDVALFDGTVAENIARFGPLDGNMIETATRITGLHDTIVGLPQGYDTPIGEGGTVLSGGMRQRVGLARAVYGSPHLVVLDEPNANLDEKGDAALMRALDVLRSAGVTVVVITHRRNLLTMSDIVLMLADGEAKALGSPSQVLQSLAGPGTSPAAAVARPARSTTGFSGGFR